jgi:hypothetical protein
MYILSLTFIDWLGYGDESITKSLIHLNQLGIVATRVYKNGLHDKYEHFPVIGGFRNIQNHKKEYRTYFNKFLKRHKSKLSA